MTEVGQRNLFGCGEYIPGTIFLAPAVPLPPIPKIIIPKNRRTGTSPPLPGGNTDPPTWTREDPVNPNIQRGPGAGGNLPPGPPVTIPPPPPPIIGVGPATPGPGGPGPGGGGGGNNGGGGGVLGPTTPSGRVSTPGAVGPATPGPSTPGPGGLGPATPGPPTPPNLGPVGPIRGPSTPGPVGPATPGPGGGGGGRGRQEEEEENPFRFEQDPPNITIQPRRLEDIGSGGSGPDDPIFSEVTQILRLQDSPFTSRDAIHNAQALSEYNRFVEEYYSNNPQDSQAGGGIQESNNFAAPGSTNYYDLGRDTESSFFSNSFSRNSNTLYDPVKNIMNHKDTPITYVNNTKYLGIFKDRIASEVAYLLNESLNPSNYEERFITGLTEIKLMLSVNDLLLEAFDRIVDANGVSVGRFYFLDKILDHLVKGTVSNFDYNYYIDLANSLRRRSATVISRNSNEQVKKNYVLSLLSKDSTKIDVSNRSVRESMNVKKMRFLLSDLESTFDVETIDGTEYQLELHDAGVEVEYAPSLGLQENVSLSGDYVPPGKGDGYYYNIETASGVLLPLVLDNQIDKAYYIKNNTRLLALNALGVDSNLKLNVSLSYDNSEYGPNYVEDYLEQVEYYKLDLKTIVTTPTNDSFIENVTATYVKVTNEDAIQDHAKTFGARVLQLNIQEDDPFFQYASRSGNINLAMKDLTFRQFVPKRTPTGDSIIVRNLPDGFILYPVRETKDNPTGGYSNITQFDTTVVRSIECDTSFHLFENELLSTSLEKTFTYDSEGIYQYGLVGVFDTQNFYYTFNRNKYTNEFSGNTRSASAKMVYEVIERLKAKYSFRYLTWWDIFRRIPAREFAKLMFDFPEIVYRKLSSGFLGFPIKDVLYRPNQTDNNLTEIDPSIPDPIYLDERDRNNLYERIR